MRVCWKNGTSFFFLNMGLIVIEAYNTSSTKFLIKIYENQTILEGYFPDQVDGDSKSCNAHLDLD